MNTLQHEQRLVRIATLCSKCTTAEEVLLELESFLPYLLQFGGMTDVIKYASAFKTLDFRKVSEETREASRKRIEVDNAWHAVNAKNAAYFEQLVDLQEENALNRTLEEYDLREYYGQNTNYSSNYIDYAILFDSSVAWEEHDATEKRNKQLQEIAIQAALEGVDYETCKSFMREYELTTEEINVFDYIYNNTVRAAEGRYRRCRRIDPNYYLAYKIRRDKELNDWCYDHGVVTPYNPQLIVESLVNNDFEPYDWGEWEEVD